MKRSIYLCLSLALVASIACCNLAFAKKPPKPDDPPEEEATTYALVSLSDVPGSAAAISQLDDVVEIAGVLYDHSGDVSIHRAHYWMADPDGNVLSIPLATLPPAVPGSEVGSAAADVNTRGVIVGSQWDGLGSRTPLLWTSATDDPVALPLPVSAVGRARATSINDAGVVVGEVETASGMDLVAWKAEIIDGVAVVGAPETILTAPTVWDGTAVTSAYVFPQVANSGYACVTLTVSSADPEFTDQRAIRLRLGWDNQQVWPVPGSTTELFDRWSIANDVNEAGTVCGRCAPPEGGWGIAYVMTASGEMLDLPTLPAEKVKRTVYSETYLENGYALTDSAIPQIIGQGSRWITQGNYEDSEKVPLLWSGESSVTDIRTVTDAASDDLWLHDINNAGWIIATDVDRPALLIPNP